MTLNYTLSSTPAALQSVSLWGELRVKHFIYSRNTPLAQLKSADRHRRTHSPCVWCLQSGPSLCRVPTSCNAISIDRPTLTLIRLGRTPQDGLRCEHGSVRSAFTLVLSSQPNVLTPRLASAKLTSCRFFQKNMATVAIPANTTALLLDIEGTTTPITFVKVSFYFCDDHIAREPC